MMSMAEAVFAVVNPTAGSGRARAVWPAVARALKARGLDFEFELTQGPMTAESFTRQALRAGADLIVAVGGDGTVNEVLNGFFLDDVPTRPDARLLIVAAGSSSDVARGHGIPDGVAAIDMLETGRVISIDIGRAAVTENGRPTTRYFLNNADVGIGGRIARDVNRFKWAGGKPAFFAASVLALLNPRPWTGRVRLDGGEPRATSAVSVLAALGPFTGGGMAVAPGAKWDDGMFDVVTVDAMSPSELLTHFPRIYQGTHLEHPGVHLERAKEILIETIDLPAIEADGEVIGTGGAELRVLPAALQVYVGRP